MAKLKINGKLVDIDVDGATPLLWVLREQLGLTGTKYSCGIGTCDACTVHINSEAVRACVVPVSSLNASQDVVTIEGLSADNSHPVQQAWAELDVPQCGYCQPGIIMTAAALLTQFLGYRYLYVAYVDAVKRAGGNLLALLLGARFFAEGINHRRLVAAILMSIGVSLVLLDPSGGG